MFCYQCGNKSETGDVYCPNCGSKHRTATPDSDPIAEKENSSFEEILRRRLSQKKAEKTPKATEVAKSSVSVSRDSVELTTQKEEGFLLFPRVAYVITGSLLILGHLLTPFAYTLDQGGTFGGIRRFEWKLTDLSSILKNDSRADEITGSSLDYLTNGYLTSIVAAVVLMGIVLLFLRKVDDSSEKYSEERSSRLSQAFIIGRVTSIVMTLLLTWQISGLFSLLRLADTYGRFDDSGSFTYFSLSNGAVLSLLGNVGLIYSGFNLAQRARADHSGSNET